MEIVKTRDTSIAHRAARIWALATAKRDDNIADSDVEAAALPLIQDSLDSSERAFVLALMQEEDMLAFVAIQPSREDDNETVGELRFMGVAPGRWGEGWARRILVAVPAAMRENGFKTGELWVYADNIRAVFVYEAMGWQGTNKTRRHPVTGRIEQKFVLKLA